LISTGRSFQASGTVIDGNLLSWSVLAKGTTYSYSSAIRSIGPPVCMLRFSLVNQVLLKHDGRRLFLKKNMIFARCRLINIFKGRISSVLKIGAE
jgi:hypothetical protein